MFVYIFFALFFVTSNNSKYVYNHVINTKFNSVKSLKEIMMSKSYFDTYLEKVNANNIQYYPNITNKILEDDLIDTFTIKYSFVPNITMLPINLPNTYTIQTWKQYDNIFDGKIETKYITFDIKLALEKNEYNNVNINVNATIKKKSFYIPNFGLKYAILDYDNICQSILHDHNYTTITSH